MDVYFAPKHGQSVHTKPHISVFLKSSLAFGPFLVIGLLYSLRNVCHSVLLTKLLVPQSWIYWHYFMYIDSTGRLSKEVSVPHPLWVHSKDTARSIFGSNVTNEQFHTLSGCTPKILLEVSLVVMLRMNSSTPSLGALQRYC